MVQYLHFRILEFPLIIIYTITITTLFPQSAGNVQRWPEAAATGRPSHEAPELRSKS